MTPTLQFVHQGWSRGFVAPLSGLGASTEITTAIGSGLLSAAGPIAMIPGGQLPAAIIAAVGSLTKLIGGFFQPDLTKIQASNIVDQIEAQTLKPMRASWQALPNSQKTPALQAAYLEVFDAAWKNVQQGCANPALQQAGVNCTADREQGACHWTKDGQTPGVPPDCGNWWTWYRDVIANDPAVAANVAAASASGIPLSTDTSASGNLPSSPITDNTKLYVGLGLLAVAALLFSMGGDS